MLKELLYRGKGLAIFLSIIALLSFSAPKTVFAEGESVIPEQEMSVQAKPLDPRAVILRDYFAKYNSPLQNYAQDFVDAADTYGVDWKLVPAIAGVESTFGKATPGNDYYPSFNGWGWGVYGTQAIYFKSWRDGIFTVTKGLKDNYISKGITSPYDINITYASSQAWGGHVAYFLNDIDQFSKSYKLQSTVALSVPSLEKNTANSSAQLTDSSRSAVSNNLSFALIP